MSKNEVLTAKDAPKILFKLAWETFKMASTMYQISVAVREGVHAIRNAGKEETVLGNTK